MPEVAPGIRCVSNGVSNWFLHEEGGKVTLVDAGKPSDWRLLVRELAVLGLRVWAVDCILLTHAHSDHTGFAERVHQGTGATAWVHSGDAAVAKGAKPGKHEARLSRYLAHREAYRTVFGLMRGGGRKIVPLTEVSTFGDGEVLDVPGRPRVVHVPGHTPGSSSLFFEGSGAVCTGDALVTLNPLTGRRGPQIMPAGLNQRSAQAMASLARLEETGAAVVLPGHGDAWVDGVGPAAEAARRAGTS